MGWPERYLEQAHKAKVISNLTGDRFYDAAAATYLEMIIEWEAEGGALEAQRVNADSVSNRSQALPDSPSEADDGELESQRRETP